MLPSTAFKKSCNAIRREGRPLEGRLVDVCFEGGSEREVVCELARFQNPDGGFGHGLESDFRLPGSSPIATTVAFQHLVKLDQLDESQPLIQAGISYLEDAFAPSRGGWFTVPATVNDFPHAPWWHHDAVTGMTVIDQHWGNPSAEIVGYLYRYRNLVRTLDVEDLVSRALRHLDSLTQYEEHEIYCYMRLYSLLPGNLSATMETALATAVSSLARKDRAEWDKYVPQPVRFVSSPESPRFGITDEILADNLDYLACRLNVESLIMPSWSWGDYPQAWNQSRMEWAGVLTLDALLTLDRFGLVDRQSPSPDEQSEGR